MADPDDASSALIARMLHEDGQAYAFATPGMYEGEDDDSPSSEEDDEEDGRRKKRRKAKGGGRGRVKAAKPPKEKATKADGGSGKKTRAAPRKWTPAEEQMFQDGLAKYGRDWKAIAEMLGTRRPRDIASHAQKAFIKMYKENVPLPAKVRESGEGYTLSGKELDPNSAAARAYGLHGKEESKRYRSAIEHRSKLGTAARGLIGLTQSEEEAASKSLDPIQVTQRSLDDLNDSPGEQAADVDGPTRTPRGKDAQPEELGAELLCQLSGAASTGRKEASQEDEKDAAIALLAQSAQRSPDRKRSSAASKSRKTKQEKEQEIVERQHAKRLELYGDDGRTEYSRNRGKRRSASRFVNKVNESLQFVSFTSYSGAPGSSTAQPFSVSVSSAVYAVVDLHSHFQTAEVMGFLAGSFDVLRQSITITKAFPGKSLIEGSTECEMDPLVEVELRQTIQDAGLTVVGWYHSHPTFECVPSSCDVSNQCNYQALFRHEASGIDPFVGLILTPYYQRLPLSQSQMSLFHVQSPIHNPTAKRLDASFLFKTIGDDDLSAMKALVRQYLDEDKGKKAHAIDFDAVWRVRTEGPVTYRAKLRDSLSVWLSRPGGAKDDAAQADKDALLDAILEGL
mmetsp:Transcript_19540/g.34815  ORF Transcript_19540/g.34815 Transcript_19540/m.34815 type:complete len:623 (-) Transcript_19540:100-1968(-)